MQRLGWQVALRCLPLSRLLLCPVALAYTALEWSCEEIVQDDEGWCRQRAGAGRDSFFLPLLLTCFAVSLAAHLATCACPQITDHAGRIPRSLLLCEFAQN